MLRSLCVASKKGQNVKVGQFSDILEWSQWMPATYDESHGEAWQKAVSIVAVLASGL